MEEKALKNPGFKEIDLDLEDYEYLIVEEPETILNDIDLFAWGIQNCFFIEDKKETIRLLKLKEAQRRLLHTYFELKLNARPDQIGARIIILKSRQQGMTTLIAAIATFEAILRSNRDALIVAHEKGDVAEKIFEIYERYLTYFPFPEWDAHKTPRGDGYTLHNESNVDVSYEKPKGIVGVTVQFLHLSEGGRFRTLDRFLGSFLPAMPKYPFSSAILESTAEKSGDAFHTMWQEAERGNSAWHPVFYPWYIDEDNVEQFMNETEREAFEKDLNIREDDIYGDEVSLLENYEAITLEHLLYRRGIINEAPHGLASFKREYPTTPEEAFMGVNQPVFDIRVLREYEKEQIRDPELLGHMEIDIEDMPSQPTKFVEEPHGIIKVYKRPNELSPGTVCAMGSDHSEGSNDWNFALIASLYPYEILAEMVGYEGFNPIPRDFARQMYHLGKWYNEAWICPESNPPGNSVIDLLLEWQYPNLITETMIFPEKGNSMRYGWRNTAESRKAALERARETVNTKLIGIPNIKLLRQLEYFCTVSLEGGRVKDQALKKGQHKALGANVDEYSDDGVFALLGLEHARIALGTPELKRKTYVGETRDEQGRLWVENTLPTIEELFGESPHSERNFEKESWRDYS